MALRIRTFGYGNYFVLGYPLQINTHARDGDERLKVLGGNKVKMLDNKLSIHEPVVAPRTRMFWTEDEHR
jgi:hypothetical protein